MAIQAARLIIAALLAVFAGTTFAQPTLERLKTPQTPWRALAPDERRVLGSVANDWDRMPGYQQQRLISSARRYPSLQPIQKERFDARIRDWATMAPEQRRAAREAFQGLRRLPPEQQHELRERWLQNHAPNGEDSSELRFGARERQRPQRPTRPSGEAPPQGR